MIVKILLNDSKNPMEYTTITEVIKAEYRYNKPSEQYMIYLEKDETFIAIPVDEIENLEIKES